MQMPLPPESVQSFYDSEKRVLNIVSARKLCLSHERLRAELQGSEVLRAETETKIKQLEAKIKQQQREIMDLRTELERERERINEAGYER